MPRNFSAPIGRWVQGDLYQPQTTNQQGQPRVFQSGPKAGQPNPQWFISVAYSKQDPAWPALEQAIRGEAAASWPALFPQGPMGPCTSPIFAMKIIDGDGFDQMGKPNNAKEGFANHWIVRYTSGFAPKVYHSPSPGVWVEINDPNAVKRGSFLRVAGTIDSNKNVNKPGVFVNLGIIELNGTGPEIVSGPSPAEAFAQPAALPPGATPLPAGGLSPGFPPPGPAFTPPPPAAVPYAVQPSPLAPPPPPPVAAPPPPAPTPYAGFMAPTLPAFIMLPSAQGATYEAMKALGWTDDAMVAAGHAMRSAPPPVTLAPPPAPPAPAPTPPPPPAPPQPVPHLMTAKAIMENQTYESLRGAGWTDAQMVQGGYMDGIPH